MTSRGFGCRFLRGGSERIDGILLLGVVVTVGALLVRPTAPFGIVVALHVMAYACFLALVPRLRAGAQIPSNRLWCAGAVLVILAVARPPAQSHDVWSYVFYGRIVTVHRASPYVHVPAAFPRDPMLRHVDVAWRSTPSVYGPLFTAVSAALAGAAGSSALAARLLFQALAASAVVAAALVVHHLTRSAAAVAVIIVNPLVVVCIVNGGHNDAVVGLGLLLSVLFVRRGRALAAGLALAAAVLVKLSALVVGGVLVVWIVRHYGRRAGLAVASTAATVILAGLVLAGGGQAMRPLEAAGRNITAATLWRPIDNELISEDRAEHVPAGVASRRAAGELTPIAAAALVGALLLVGWSSAYAPDAALPAALAVATFVVLGTYVLPWYLGWGLPLLAVSVGAAWSWRALAYGALLHLAYVPDYTKGAFFATGSRVAVMQTGLRTVVVPLLAGAFACALVVSVVRGLWAPHRSAAIG